MDAQGIFGLLFWVVILMNVVIAYLAMPESGNQAGLCIIIPGYAFYYSIRSKWYKLAGSWFVAFSGAVLALVATGK